METGLYEVVARRSRKHAADRFHRYPVKGRCILRARPLAKSDKFSTGRVSIIQPYSTLFSLSPSARFHLSRRTNRVFVTARASERQEIPL